MTSTSGIRDRRAVRWMRVILFSLLVYASFAATPSSAQTPGLQGAYGAQNNIYAGPPCIVGTVSMLPYPTWGSPQVLVSGSISAFDSCQYGANPVVEPALGMVFDVFYLDSSGQWQFCSGTGSWGYSLGVNYTSGFSGSLIVAGCPSGSWVRAQMIGISFDLSGLHFGRVETSEAYYY